MKGLRYGGAIASSAMPPRPNGLWGLTGQEVAALPGYRDPARDRADAKKLLAEAGFGPVKPLRVELATRSWALQTDLAVFVQPYVRNLVPHHVIYNYARMQEVWLDK